jgi:hypothetical protein
LSKPMSSSLELLRKQAVKEAQSPKKREPPLMRKNSSSGLFEYDYPEDRLGQ